MKRSIVDTIERTAVEMVRRPMKRPVTLMSQELIDEMISRSIVVGSRWRNRANGRIARVSEVGGAAGSGGRYMRYQYVDVAPTRGRGRLSRAHVRVWTVTDRFVERFIPA